MSQFKGYAMHSQMQSMVNGAMLMRSLIIRVIFLSEHVYQAAIAQNKCSMDSFIRKYLL